MKQLENVKHIFFLGIGGIGMSALARYFVQRNVKISGYDKTETDLTQTLVKEGMHVVYEDDVTLIPADIDLVVFTPAIPKTLGLYNYFQRNNFEIFKRSQILGLISRNAKCLAVAGSHGKTSVSCMLTHLLRNGGIDCSAFLGGISKNLNSNFVLGSSDYVVIEADEFDRSFLQLYPHNAIITHIDDDHLDIYGSQRGVEEAFIQFSNQIVQNGYVVLSENICIKDELRGNKISYGYGLHNDYIIRNYTVNTLTQTFDLAWQNGIIQDIELTIAGKHNVENAVAASIVAMQCGVKSEKIKQGLQTFAGIKRRFDIIHHSEKITYVDDYAHHPEELKAFLTSLRNIFPTKKISVVFQPHLFTRTRDHAEGMARTLSLADDILLLDIYPAREEPIEGVTSALIADYIKEKPVKIVSKSDALKYAEHNEIEVFATVGAGDIDTLVPSLKQIFANK